MDGINLSGKFILSGLITVIAIGGRVKKIAPLKKNIRINHHDQIVRMPVGKVVDEMGRVPKPNFLPAKKYIHDSIVIYPDAAYATRFQAKVLRPRRYRRLRDMDGHA